MQAPLTPRGHQSKGSHGCNVNGAGLKRMALQSSARRPDHAGSTKRSSTLHPGLLELDLQLVVIHSQHPAIAEFLVEDAQARRRRPFTLSTSRLA